MAIDYLLQEDGDQIILESGLGHLILEVSADTGVKIAGDAHPTQVFDFRGITKDQEPKWRKTRMQCIPVNGRIKCYTEWILLGKLVRWTRTTMESRITHRFSTAVKSRVWRSGGWLVEADLNRNDRRGIRRDATFDTHTGFLEEKMRKAKREKLKGLYKAYEDIDE